MYNTYYERKTGKGWAAIFDEHSKKFKPTIEILKRKPRLKSYENFKEFIYKDIVNLFQRPYLRESKTRLL
jgi:hypothetical protein